MKKIIFYDLETTGRSAHWDQIIQIAAICTDEDFNVLDKINLTGKLNSFAVPDPEALLVNKIPIEKIFVFHDDLDLNFCKVKFKTGGGTGGHNGLKNIDISIGNTYHRIRVGIGKPITQLATNHYVLSNFSKKELESVNKKINLIAYNINYLLNNDHNNFLNNISESVI